VQRVVVLYYLADDSVQVTEPKQDNSGIPQVGAAFCPSHPAGGDVALVSSSLLPALWQHVGTGWAQSGSLQ